MCKAVRGAIFDLIVIAIVLGYTLGKYVGNDITTCKAPIAVWIIVYCCIQLTGVFKKVLIAIKYGSFIILFLVGTGSDHTMKFKNNIDLVFCCAFLNFEVAWLIYGNTFIYSEDGMYCKDDGDSRSLWILMIICIAFGYLIFFLYLILA